MTNIAFAPLAGAFLALDNAETWVLAAFILFVGLLIYLGVPGMLTRALDARAVAIREQLEEARQLREEAQARLAKFERQQHEVSRLADEIVASARKDAESAAAQAKLDLEASVARRLAAAEDQIAMAEADAVRAVRDGAVDAAIGAARKILSERYQGDAASALLDQGVKEVAARVN
ncbi:MAG: ATP F0F1 synthase subunit B [Neomegalonema sp.]|nr:ATP F0F1 synthase subunit B [Neomegalonema sp.]